ncbi:hypothetical protein SAMN05444349_11478 [Bacteroides faecichinchillae]|uniref:Uncharacterized protein n=1 Tax=Bacteroides faecichinchillae TaxID=871325 RepID=A0A1M5A6H1_9BACE|nr:hypothetical protein [Bacteroides faecichinchillae]THG68487.1 hypothetical protein E5981_04920 [Bacteroides faecichinchillae]SHF25727.1 hypothetical protein SAMN05444349_11478 [Bacteroides faecichinchillae]
MSVNEMLKSTSKLNFDTSFGICVQRGKESQPKGKATSKKQNINYKNQTDMKKSAKTVIRNSKNNNTVSNVKSATVSTVATKTENDVEEVIETVVENGVNYGSPNIKMMKTVTIYKNGDYNTKQHFYINGYKFRMDEHMRYSMKHYLMEVIPSYKEVEDIDKMLTQNINFKIGSEAPDFLKIRMKQQTTLVRGLIKALRESTNLKAELTAILGETKYEKIFLHNDFSGEIVCNWKTEWKKDYSASKYKL